MTTVSKKSNPDLFNTLCELADFDTSHVPKHGKGFVIAEAEHEGKFYRTEAEWDYSWGVKWDYQEWEEADPYEQVPCVTCGRVDPEEVPLEDLDYENLLEMRLELNQSIELINAELTNRNVPIMEKLVAGHKVTGFKLKKGRKTRKVKDESLLVQAVTDLGMTRSSLYDAKLKGVPALEKLFKETFTKEVSASLYEDCIEETEGKPSLEYVGS